MFELKIHVIDKPKVVSFLKTLSFVSSEYVLLDTDGSLTVKLDGVPLSGYNVADLLDCGTIDRFLFDGKEFPKGNVRERIEIKAKSHATEEKPEEKSEEKTESIGNSKEVWPAIDLIINNSTDTSAIATQLYKYLGIRERNATKFEALVAYYLQHADMHISWANFQKAVPEFNISCITSFRKKSSEKGYKGIELLKYILTSDVVKSMVASNGAESEEQKDEATEEVKEEAESQARQVVLECMPKLCDTGDEQAVKEFEDFLINCDKTQPLSTLLKDMLKVAIPNKAYDDVIIDYALDALSSMDIEAYVNNEPSLDISKQTARLAWATIATKIAEKYDRLNEKVITAADFLKDIKPYLVQ